MRLDVHIAVSVTTAAAILHNMSVEWSDRPAEIAIVPNDRIMFVSIPAQLNIQAEEDIPNVRAAP